MEYMNYDEFYKTACCNFPNIMRDTLFVINQENGTHITFHNVKHVLKLLNDNQQWRGNSNYSYFPFDLS